MKTSEIVYRNFLIEVKEKPETKEMQCIAYWNGEPRFGTFSHLDKVNAKQKMFAKIDLFLRD